MNLACAEQIANPYDAAREQLESLIGKLLLEDHSNKLSHSVAEDLINKEGRETLRLLFEEFLNRRGQMVSEEKVQGADEIIRTHDRLQERAMETIFGRVRFERHGYSQRGFGSLMPSDAHLNIPNDLYSHGVQKVLAREVAGSSFDETTAALSTYTGAK